MYMYIYIYIYHINMITTYVNCMITIRVVLCMYYVDMICLVLLTSILLK